MRVAWLALLALGCGAEEAPVDSDAPSACEGAGAATVEVGSGGRSAFVPFEDGDDIAAVDLAGTWGLQLELLTTGLDTTADASSVVRIQYEPGAPTEDYVGLIRLQCDDDEGIAWANVVAGLPEPWQGYPGSLVGAALQVRVTVTDASGEAAADEVELRVIAR